MQLSAVFNRLFVYYLQLAAPIFLTGAWCSLRSLASNFPPSVVSRSFLLSSSSFNKENSRAGLARMEMSQT
jgi:hypothetical protein